MSLKAKPFLRSSRSARAKPPSPQLKEELRSLVAKEIGALAKPDDIASPTCCPRLAAAKSCVACFASWHERRGQRRHDNVGKISA